MGLSMTSQSEETCGAAPTQIISTMVQMSSNVLQEKACGDMMKFLSPSQRVHVKGKESDRPGMWAALVAIHLQQAPGTRFSAHNKLFSIVKSPSESLTNVSACVSDAMGHIQELRLQAFDIKKLNKEIQLC
jgi:hypothetical protein